MEIIHALIDPLHNGTFFDKESTPEIALTYVVPTTDVLTFFTKVLKQQQKKDIRAIIPILAKVKNGINL
ncbi:MAG: hypothetical protein LBU22_04300 [Dysgonamonadaceae bacterium]|jgi:hypothetical protein|nr:hypothetical protein [Dysgonamonadaceae bacterium]